MTCLMAGDSLGASGARSSVGRGVQLGVGVAEEAVAVRGVATGVATAIMADLCAVRVVLQRSSTTCQLSAGTVNTWRSHQV